MKRLILKNLKQRQTQVISMVTTIAICATVFVSLLLLYGGMQRGVELNEQRGGADLMVIPADTRQWVTDSEFLFSGAPVVSYFNADIVDKIAAMDGVKRVTVQFYGQTLASGCCSTGNETRIIGFDFDTDWIVKPYCQSTIASLADDEVIIGCKVQAFKNGTDTVLGKKMRLAAVLDETGSGLDYSILMNIDVVREIAAASSEYAHYWDTYGHPSQIVSTVMIDLEDGVTYSNITREIKRLDGSVTTLRRSEVIADSQETLNVVFGMMLIAGIVLAVVSALQMVARYYSSVWERKSELALYRALGATAKDLQRMIGGEAFVVTGTGCVIGTALGVALYFAGYAYLQGVEAFPFSALPWWLAVLGVVAVFALFAGITALSIIAPLRQVTRIDPARAMQQVDIG